MERIKLTFVLILFCVFECFAMSYSELEDFAEYLAQTSQLTPSLKQGIGDFDEFDEDGHVSDNAWEESGKFEGDLILNERQRRLIVQNVAEQGLARNGIIDGAKRWPNNEVIYAIQVEHFSDDQVQAIQAGIDDIARASCIKFRRYKQGDRDAVVIQGNRRGCFSQVGYQGGYQALNLNSRHPVGRGCFRHGTVVHELLHSLGFYHMQSSPDRDDYVDIIWDNILKSSRHNFRKYNTFTVSDFGVGYDYDSVLHYSRNAFSVNGKPTIVPKQRGADIGQRLGMSDKDTEKLNKMYCDAESDSAQSAEDSKEKSKKKSSKNKPFEGHGLGYHKGTAVAFKLLPEAETYKIADVPSSHVFDYFSKPPQILSTAEKEDFRNSKKLAYPYRTPALVLTQEVREPTNYGTTQEMSRPKEIQKGIQHVMPEILNLNQANVEDTREAVHKEGLTDENPDLIEAFDRLSKIIKSHVYPSQTPDLSIYKIEDRYQKLQSNGNVEKRPAFPTQDNSKDLSWEGAKGELDEYQDFIPHVNTDYLKTKQVENNSNQRYPLIKRPEYDDKFEKFIDQNYRKYYPEEEYAKLSSIKEGDKKIHRNQDGWIHPSSYKDSINHNRGSYSDFSRNSSEDDDYDEVILKRYY